MTNGRHAAAWLFLLLLAVSTTIPASAQDNAPAQNNAPAQDNTQPPGNAQAPGTVAANSLSTNTTGDYSQQQLDQMLAPVALYPDKLVMNILMASTYPDQLAQAQDWLKEPGHAGLKGDALLAAVKPQPWDPSIKAIVQFPQVVNLMTQNPNWTQSVGAAFDNQQDDVLSQIQYLRHQAQGAGNLASNDKIVVQNEGPNDISIAPAQPDVVAAPYYNPAVVYGAWPWAAYPPVYFSPVYFGVAALPVGVVWAWGPTWYIAPPLWGWYNVGWVDGGLFFVAGGWGPSFGWFGRGWAGGSWRGGGWRHGGGGHFGFAGFHGRAGFGGGGPGGRGGFGGARGASASHFGGAGGRGGGMRAGGGRGGGGGGMRAGGGRGGGRGGMRAGGGRGGGRGGMRAGGGRGGGGRYGMRGGGGRGGGRYAGGRGGMRGGGGRGGMRGGMRAGGGHFGGRGGGHFGGGHGGGGHHR